MLPPQIELVLHFKSIGTPKIKYLKQSYKEFEIFMKSYIFSYSDKFLDKKVDIKKN